MAYPRFMRARAFKFVTITSGSITLNSATWAAISGTALDLTLEAQSGDVIECGFNGLLQPSTTATTVFDVASIVSSAGVNWWAGNTTFTTTRGVTDGVPAWRAEARSDARSNYLQGTILRTIATGDIASGLVTVRPFYVQYTNSAQSLFATSSIPLQFFAKNLGPVDPH